MAAKLMEVIGRDRLNKKGIPVRQRQPENPKIGSVLEAWSRVVMGSALCSYSCNQNMLVCAMVDSMSNMPTDCVVLVASCRRGTLTVLV